MEDFDRTATAVAITFAAVWAYFALAIVQFADPVELIDWGGLLAVSAAGSWLSVKLGWARWWHSIFVVGLVGSIGGMTFTIGKASAAYRANEKRCAALQTDMLSAKPRRADAPEIFEALKCQAQGEEAVQFPRPQKVGAQIQA